MSPKKKNDPLILIETAIEGISFSLSELAQVKEQLTELSGPAFIDLAARLNAQANAIEGILKPMKDTIKAKALSDEPEKDTISVKGTAYQAVVQRIKKSCLMTTKVKEFLGRELSKFMEDRYETHVTFQVKE